MIIPQGYPLFAVYELAEEPTNQASASVPVNALRRRSHLVTGWKHFDNGAFEPRIVLGNLLTDDFRFVGYELDCLSGMFDPLKGGTE